MCSYKSFFVLALFLSMLFPINSFSQDSVEIKKNYLKKQNNLKKELEQINEKAKKEQKLLSDSKLELANAKKDLENISGNIIVKENKIKNLRKEISKIDKSINELNGSILVNKGKISLLKQNFSSRFRSMFKLTKSSASIDFFTNSKNLIELEKRRTFLSRIVKADKELILAVSQANFELQKSYSKQEKLRVGRAENLDEVTLLLKNLNNDQKNKNIYIKEKEKSNISIKTAIAMLEKSAIELEVSIKKLFTGKSIKAKRDSKLQKIFKLSKKSLVFPIQGEIIHKFGKRKHKEFKDFVFSKGIEIKSSINSKVKAVAPGVVILNKDLPGYGKVIIVDHGSRVYSLYAKIKKNLVNLGQNIKAGHYLATVSDKEPFYFELRKKGKAVNPQSYFVITPASVAS